MRILLVGNYEFWMCRRSEVIYEGLKENGVDVINFVDRSKGYNFRLMKTLLKRDFDAAIVNGILPFFITWILKPIHRKRIILDAFISRYNTEVEDKKTTGPNSLKAGLLFASDKYSCLFSDHVILDTKEHAEYFISKFSLDQKKVSVVYVGANEKAWKKNRIDVIHNRKFNIAFWGSFSPLQGTDVILEAAKLLQKDKDIVFHMLGFTEKSISSARERARKEKIGNIIFKSGITTDHGLVDYVNSCDACLGIFGDTVKARMVIPHKAYEAIALGKPLVTLDSTAAREIFINNQNCLLIEGGRADKLSAAISDLKNDPDMRTRLADQGFLLFKKRFDNRGIGKQIVEVINNESDNSMRRKRHKAEGRD